MSTGETKEVAQLQKADKLVVHALEVAATVVGELARVADADRVVVTTHCQEFLSTISQIQDILEPAIAKFGSVKTFQGSAYLERAKADVAALKVDALAGRLSRARKILEALEPPLPNPNPAGTAAAVTNPNPNLAATAAAVINPNPNLDPTAPQLPALSEEASARVGNPLESSSIAPGEDDSGPVPMDIETL